MYYIIAALVGYLVGCFNTAYVVSRVKGIDMRKRGTKNLGASNATILFGWRIGLLVGLVDILKGTLVVLIFRALLEQMPIVWLVSGTACVLGHIFPFYLKFRGGKGFATVVGVILGCDWQYFLLAGVMILLVTWITDYIVMATTTTVLAFPLHMGLSTGNLLAVCVLLPITLIILYKHLPNLKRIFIDGDEFTLGSAAQGTHRVDKTE